MGRGVCKDQRERERTSEQGKRLGIRLHKELGFGCTPLNLRLTAMDPGSKGFKALCMRSNAGHWAMQAPNPISGGGGGAEGQWSVATDNGVVTSVSAKGWFVGWTRLAR